MKTIYNTFLILLISLLLFSCNKDDSITENPISENVISGLVKLPTGSSLDVNSLQIASAVDVVNISDGSYQMNSLRDQFLTQLVSNTTNEVFLMGFSYPGQTNFEINSKSTALAMLMNLPTALLMAPEGKQQLISKILNHPNLPVLTAKIDQLLVDSKSPLDITQVALAEEIATLYEQVFSTASKSYRKKSDHESYPIDIWVASNVNEITFVNPGKSYETVVGIYKDDQLIETINIPRVSFVPTGIGDVIGAIASANQGETPSGLQPVEKTFTMDVDGEYEIRVRNGFYTNGLDSENIQAYLINLITWNTDILLEVLPFGDCVQPLLSDLKEFIQTTVTLVDGNPSSGELLGLLYNLLSEFLAQSALTSGCFQSAGSTVFTQSLQQLLSFTALVGTLGHVGNTFLGIAQWYYDDGAMNECYKAEGGAVSECNGTDVYVAGLEWNDVDGTKATVWKNGVATVISASNSAAYSVYVSGTDMYVAGEEFINGEAYATVWKNGVATRLSSVRHSRAHSVYVSGTDVYVAGGVVGGGVVAIVWKNGVATSLGGAAGRAYSVYVSGTDVYVAGEEQEHSGVGLFVATVWKNGVATSLSGALSTAGSVYVSGTDVYVTGGISGVGAVVWKNGVATSLAGGGVTTSVYVSGTDVYVAGYSYNNYGTGSKAIVWKNGVATYLPDDNNGASVRAYSVYVSGTDVYVAGRSFGNGFVGKAIVWKNGVATSLAGSSGGLATSVFVK